jgi:hypothetical protein
MRIQVPGRSVPPSRAPSFPFKSNTTSQGEHNTNQAQHVTSRKRQVCEDSDKSLSDRGAKQSQKRLKGKGKGKTRKPVPILESVTEPSSEESDEPQAIKLTSDPENLAEHDNDEVHS